MSNWTIILVSILLSAFFSGMEIAYISSNKLKLEIDKQSSSHFARVLRRIFRYPLHYITTILIGNNICLVIYAVTMAKILEPLILEWSNSVLIIFFVKILLSTLIILVTAEFLPKVFFRLNSNLLLKTLIYPLTFFYYLLKPLVIITLFLSKRVLKLFGLDFVEYSPVFDKLDLEEYVKLRRNEVEHRHQDVEVQIFQNALDFSNVKVRECMLPRTEIIAVDFNSSIDDLLKIFIDTKLSKVLVYRQNIDNILGYVHSSEIFKSPKNIKSILLPISHVPGYMMANDMLQLFIKEQKKIAIVIDEFGGTSGMVTIEDLFEEILGEIDDEFDVYKDLEIRINDNNFTFSARLEIDYLNEKYNLKLPSSDEYETLGGLLINMLEDIPEKNKEINVGEYTIVVREVSQTKIQSVSLYKTL
tara:strand:- start:101 stop:1348 length:1248 start_codon:yes stop_codon:yes gene_type:complete